MKRYVIIVVTAFAVAGIWIATGWSQPQPNKVRDFMRAKLDHSQKLLEGLTLEDYDLIAKNAQAISLLSQEANWQVLQTPDYLRHSQDFRRTADAITEAARKKNLDGAALGYVELTMRCINCHKYVRGVKGAAAELPENKKQSRGN
jgi:hypothetical protein